MSAVRQSSEILFTSPSVTLMRITCRTPRSGLTETYETQRAWIGLPLSGVFTVVSGGEEQPIHAAVGVVFPHALEYRMRHPCEGGDLSATLGLAPEVMQEAFPLLPERVTVTPLDLRLRHRVGVMIAAAERGQEPLAIEERALDVVGSIARGIGCRRTSGVSASTSRTVDRVRTLLAEAPEIRWTLESLGRFVGYSPFYLARQFRAHTGMSVHRYLADLRAAAALRRIEAGDVSLAAIAADLGFSHHSHLTATLRRRLEVTPSMIREQRRGTGRTARAHQPARTARS